jgi:hypothetical protein
VIAIVQPDARLGVFVRARLAVMVLVHGFGFGYVLRRGAARADVCACEYPNMCSFFFLASLCVLFGRGPCTVLGIVSPCQTFRVWVHITRRRPGCRRTRPARRPLSSRPRAIQLCASSDSACKLRSAEDVVGALRCRVELKGACSNAVCLCDAGMQGAF